MRLSRQRKTRLKYEQDITTKESSDISATRFSVCPSQPNVLSLIETAITMETSMLNVILAKRQS
jgi:hypothetical protein